MSFSHTEPVVPAGNTSARRSSGILAIFLACSVVVATVCWGPAIVRLAQALRPYQLNNVSEYSDTELRAVVGPARLHLWIVIFASFAAIGALALLAVVLGRRSLRTTGSEAVRSRLGAWATRCLVGGLVIGLGSILLSSVGWFFDLNTSQWVLLMSVAMASALGSVMLSVTALGHPASESARADVRSVAWRRGARIRLLAESLLLLAVFVVIVGTAQFFVGFYLRLVY